MSTGLIWFENNLRVKDNKTLFEACEKHEQVIAVYCFDPRKFKKTKYGFPKTGKFRAKFLIESIKNLQENLNQLNIFKFLNGFNTIKSPLNFYKF